MIYHPKVIAGGRIAIPADVRRELGIRDGGPVALARDPDGISLCRENPHAVLIRMRDSFKGYSVARFLHERRADWGA